MQTETTARLTTLTPTEKTLYDLLRNNLRVRKIEMYAALDMVGDEYDYRALRVHICKLRKKVENLGLRIIVEMWQRRMYYTMVRNTHSADE